jgi:hypothetical protein
MVLKMPSMDVGSRLTTADSPHRFGDLAVADRAHRAQLLGEDQVGLCVGQSVGVEPVNGTAAVNGSRHAGVDLAAGLCRRCLRIRGDYRHRRRLSRVVALVCAADQLVAEPKRVHDLGRGR